MSSTFVGAYTTGLFGNHGSWQGETILSQLENSNISDVILWSIHVHSNGDLHYNNEPLVIGGKSQVAAEHIKMFIGSLRRTGSINQSPKNFWFSIGSGGVSDYASVHSLLNSSGLDNLNFLKNLEVLFNMGAIGFDFDYEESFANTGIGPETIPKFTVELYKRFGSRITYCPFCSANSFWLPCLATTYTLMEQAYQPVEAFNLQCYSGGAENLPVTWASDLDTWSTGTTPPPPTGVSHGTGFVRPILAVTDSNDTDTSGSQYTPATMTTELQSTVFINTGASGASIWQTADVIENPATLPVPTIGQYATAIVTGLSGS